MNSRIEPIEAALQDVQLTVTELAALCAVTPQWVIERVRMGLIEAAEGDIEALRFGAAALRRVRTMRSVELAFDAAPELAALVADLGEEIARLRAALRSGVSPW